MSIRLFLPQPPHASAPRRRALRLRGVELDRDPLAALLRLAERLVGGGTELVERRAVLGQ